MLCSWWVLGVRGSCRLACTLSVIRQPLQACNLLHNLLHKGRFKLRHVSLNQVLHTFLELLLLLLQVWDIRNNKCLQTLVDKHVYRPEDSLTCLMYDPKRRWLLSGANLLKVRLLTVNTMQL